jgi:hypothetical protein
MPEKDHVLIWPLKADESAVFSLPFRLTVSCILFAVLLLLSSASIYSFLDDAKEKKAFYEISKLTAAAEQLSMRGSGSEISLEMSLPEEVKVDFGTLPGRQDEWPADSNNYCLHIGGKTEFYSSTAFFSNSEFNGPLSLGPGNHRLLLSSKLEPESGKLFVIISEKDF